jgi:hypothetical protein
MQVLTETEVRAFIDRTGPHIDARYDYTYPPEYPEGRADVCAVRRLAENGSSYGFDTLYLVWKRPSGSIGYRTIADSRASKDYLHIDKITADGDTVTVAYRSGGSFSGQPFEKTVAFRLDA